MLYRALSWVANSMPLHQTVTLSLFETTIRIVGGLVSAYDLSGNATALTKAEELVQKLLPAFEGGGNIHLCYTQISDTLRILARLKQLCA